MTYMEPRPLPRGRGGAITRLVEIADRFIVQSFFDSWGAMRDAALLMREDDLLEFAERGWISADERVAIDQYLEEGAELVYVAISASQATFPPALHEAAKALRDHGQGFMRFLNDMRTRGPSEWIGSLAGPEAWVPARRR